MDIETHIDMLMTRVSNTADVLAAMKDKSFTDQQLEILKHAHKQIGMAYLDLYALNVDLDYEEERRS